MELQGPQIPSYSNYIYSFLKTSFESVRKDELPNFEKQSSIAYNLQNTAWPTCWSCIDFEDGVKEHEGFG